MEEKVKEIQNSVWGLYKDYLSTKNVKKFTDEATKLNKKYSDDELTHMFSLSLILSYTLIVNRMANQGDE
jgi:hypothetical protein